MAEEESKPPRTTHKLLQVPISCLCSNYALILIFMKEDQRIMGFILQLIFIYFLHRGIGEMVICGADLKLFEELGI